MGAENPEAVLEDDDGDDKLYAGAMALFVAFVVTCVVIAGAIIGSGVTVELYALAVTIWVLGACLRALEVTQR